MPNPKIMTQMSYDECQMLRNILWTVWSNNFAENAKDPRGSNPILFISSSTNKAYTNRELWKLYFKTSKRLRKLDKKWIAAL